MKICFQSLRQDKGNSGGKNQHGICDLHKKPSKMFCKNSTCLTAICENCWSSNHYSHLVVPLQTGMKKPLGDTDNNWEKTDKIQNKHKNLVAESLPMQEDMCQTSREASRNPRIWTLKDLQKGMASKIRMYSTAKFCRETQQLFAATDKGIEIFKIENGSIQWQRLLTISGITQDLNVSKSCHRGEVELSTTCETPIHHKQKKIKIRSHKKF